MKVHFETSGPLAILALANPPLNLLSGELLDELGAAVRELKRLPIRALMLRAEGKVFSAGADVSAFKGKTESAARESFAAHQQMITDLEALPFPTLAGCSRHVCRRRAGGGARVRSHLGNWRQRSEPQRCSVVCSVWPNGLDQHALAKAYTPPNRTTRQRLSGGTS